MDKVMEVFDNTDGVIKPEILFYYGACAVLITVFVNWALTTLLFILKPFTCAGILVAFLRPDLVQDFMSEERIRLFVDKLRAIFLGFMKLILYIGRHLRSKLA